VRDLLLLLGSRLRQMRNRWTRGRRGRAWQRRLAPLSILIWLGFLGLGSLSAFRSLQSALGSAAESVALEALAGAFSAGMLLVLFNGMRQSFDTFFLADDLALLFSTPLSRRAIFVAQFLAGMLDNGTYALMMILPPGVAFLYAFAAPWSAYLWLVAAGLLLLAGLTAVGILLDLFVARVVPPARARQVVVTLNILLILGTVLLYNAFSVRMIEPEQALTFLSRRYVSRQSALPAVWMAQSLAALLPARAVSFWRPAALLAGTAGGAAALAVWVSGWLYGRGWSATRQAPRRRRRQRAGPARLARGSSPLRAFLLKDVRYFARDTRSWATLLFGLILLVFFSFSFARDATDESSLAATLTPALFPAMTTGIAARWLLAAFAREGEAWWVVQASPLRDEDVLGAKFVLNYALCLASSWVAVVAFDLLVALPPLWLLAALVLTAVVVAGTTSLGLAVAAWRTDVGEGVTLRRDLVGTYVLLGLLGLYVGLPVAGATVVERLPLLVGGGSSPLPTASLVLLLIVVYLPITAAVWAGMRVWTLRSLRRMRVEP
jgi:hypothetical protein